VAVLPMQHMENLWNFEQTWRQLSQFRCHKDVHSAMAKLKWLLTFYRAVAYTAFRVS
jgi:hypothetical protein